jgi:two-component system, OmpR family, sensor histidine kinase BaeS
MPERYGPPWARDWSRQGGWGGPGRHVFRRVIGFVFFLVLAGAVVGAVFATGFAALSGSERWLIVAATVAAIALFAFVARRMFRRNLAPVGRLIEATRRLGEGDQGVRLDITGPGPFFAVGRSFNKMAERLEEEDVRRRRLIADIGHELRTPMTVIRGEVEAVLDGLHSPTDLSNVIDEIDVIDRLLDDLRLLSMAEAGTLRLETEPTDIGDLVRAVVGSFSNMTAAHAVEVRVEADEVGEIDVDPHRIHQVISNLVANALSQMPEGGRLDVTVTGDAEALTIRVADTGPGIPDDDFEKVFDRFVRSTDSTGTGLGLSISRDLVETHGGTITAANRESGGAVFTVDLPRAR